MWAGVTGSAFIGSGMLPQTLPMLIGLPGMLAFLGVRLGRSLRQSSAFEQAEIPYESGGGKYPPRVGFARADGGDGWRIHIESIVSKGHVSEIIGSAAYRAAGSMLPVANVFGASRSAVADAVRLLEVNVDPQAHFAKTVDRLCRAGYAYASMEAIPPAMRSSLEIAAHEESERRALEGELAALEAQWRLAEEIAGIADNLLLPPSVGRFIEKHRP